MTRVYSRCWFRLSLSLASLPPHQGGKKQIDRQGDVRSVSTWSGVIFYLLRKKFGVEHNLGTRTWSEAVHCTNCCSYPREHHRTPTFFLFYYFFCIFIFKGGTVLFTRLERERPEMKSRAEGHDGVWRPPRQPGINGHHRMWREEGLRLSGIYRGVHTHMGAYTGWNRQEKGALTVLTEHPDKAHRSGSPHLTSIRLHKDKTKKTLGALRCFTSQSLKTSSASHLCVFFSFFLSLTHHLFISPQMMREVVCILPR